ncbi:zinc finger protein 469 [Sphaerodactylus townsendi]|uniref:zinc finger protein 469 n=1 Tax=Sphaerodactylus townsendi TaxID=933632 RepID=UPI0020273BF9|nr:zinc finger protein 469 [Sphaerodactylus townsendi]XP_048372058.1 zinc finger protein 469 [Sphaerodactylus townsendi]XP_048372059.1 zinc finger protein 469 [Sphaerodactylus townsendi]
MMGETQRAYVTNDIESSAQDKDISFEHFGKKDVSDAFDSRLLDCSEPCLHEGAENGSSFTSTRDKEPQNQREAVIRPQQAGKIDFRSLHNRPSFPSDSPWGAVKGSPQSPTGKSRARDKNRRSGKAERGHQQLYRLTISNARPNPTIGIAYPQQKVTPPKKVELSRGPVSGSYRFHVPRIPEREVELQQEDLSFTRCFPEAASSHISSNYTSPTAAARPNHGAKMQPPVVIPHESSGSSGQLHYLEFQGSGNNSWPPPDKSLPGTNSGLSAPTACPFLDTSKSKARCLGPSSFQYPFQALHSPAADTFQGDASAQDYVDISLATSPASHGALAFHSSSKDWKEEALGNDPYENVAPESRLYGLAPPLAPFLPSPTQGHLPCYKGRNEHSTDPNGAISPSGAIDQNPSTLQENQAVFPPSLHVSSMPKPIGKRQSSLKDSVASQRILDAGSLLRRSVPQISLPQVHFQNKAYGDPPASGLGNPGSVPFEKSLSSPAQNHPRLLQAWEAGKRPYSPTEQNTMPYTSPAGSQLCFGGHSGPEQRQHVRKAWHHLHLASAVPGQNRIELSRKLASQKLPFSPEWEGHGKAHKGATGYAGKVLLTGEGAIMQRHNPGLQSCSSVNAICLDGAKDADLPAMCGSRSKPLFFNVSQAAPPASSRLPSSSALVLPPLTLVASPSDSPLPSPAPNPTSGSSCSSLSPLSSSPSSLGFEDGTPLTTSPFFHHPCHPKDGMKPVHISEPLCTGSAHYHAAEPVKAFHLSQGASKDDLLYKGIPMEGGFHKPNVEASQGCLEGFVAEAPPPPYSSHHLLASSLSSASLDQLDVFLTCKQCDQNFSNLSSFLEHRQFCSAHVALQGQMKDSSHGTEIRKQPNPPLDSGKHVLGPLLLPSSHLQLLALNKTADFLADGEGKGEPREDPLRMNQLSSLVNPLPLSTSDLEIDDAKLDSLITEALNGLGYQSDNPEIDSSFIDVFADEELASVKVTTGGAPYKAKDGKKMKHVGTEENVKMGSCYEDNPCGDLAKIQASGKQQGPNERGAAWCPDHGGEPFEKQNRTDSVRSKAADPAMDDRVQNETNTQLKVGRKSCGSFLPAKQATKTFSERKQPKNVKCAYSLASDLRPVGEPVAAAGNPKISAKEVKKRKLRSGTWSKELIHKIVQQKNKLHKLHTKSTKAVPLSLLADRLLPETKDSRFGEYEYMSESDDERVEYAKRHCRRKLGSRFGGKLRSGFSRRHPGRGGREKDKEAAWSYGQRKAREEPQRASGKEAGRKDGCVAKLRSRSCRSSTSSYRSTPFPSEASSSPQSTERADSDTEKEGEQRKSPPPNPERARPLPRGFLNVPARETRGRSRTLTSDWSGEPDGVNLARILPPVFKVHRNDSPDISPVSSTNEEEGLLRSQESLHPSRTAPGQSPAVLFGSEESEQYSGRAKEEKPRPPGKAPEPCELGTDQRWPQIAAYNGQYHVEDLIGPSPTDNSRIPTDEDAAYDKVDTKHLEKQQPFISPINCFSDNPVGLGMAEKGLSLLVSTADTFYGCKELPSSYESPGLFPGSPAIEPPHSDNVYLCPGDVGSFKRKPPGILPYEADQSKLSSPLSFDSSSVFAEIPVANFDATLYDSVSPSKDSYATFPGASNPLGKMIPFDQQYSSFLPEKDWNQLVDVLPVLPEDLAPFHSLPVEKPFAKRFPSEIDQMPMPLPERIADYNEPFMNSISDDDLEIKRLVTELESQLQTSKLSVEASEEHQTPEHPTDTEQESVNRFSPLTLEQPSDGKALFLVEDEFENAGLLSTKDCLCENSASEKTLLPDLDPKYGHHQDLWPCLVQFSPLPSTMSPSSTADLILVGPLSSKESHEKLDEDLEDSEITGEDGFRETRNVSSRIIPVPENIEVPSYTDHLIQSPDPLFPKTLEAAVLNIHEALPLEADGFPKLSQKEKTVDSAAELKSYGHQPPCLKPELGLQDVRAQEDDGGLPSSSHPVEDPEESLLNKRRSPEMLGSRDEDESVLLEKAKEAEGVTSCQDPVPCDKTGHRKALLFEALPFSKEVEGGAEYASGPQGKSANPLQQLQLFVAQTVKNNEEDLLLPCFPVLHPASLLPTSASEQTEKEEGIADSVLSAEGAESPTLEERKRTVGGELGSKSSDSAELHLEAVEQAGRLGGAASHATEQLGLPCLTDACSAEADINRCTSGLSAEHSNLSLLSNSSVTSLLREKGAQGAAVTGEQEKTTLTFRSHRKSPLSPGSFEQDTPSHALPAALKIQVTHCAAWGEAGPKEQALCDVKTQSIELSGDRSQQDTPAAPTSPPENHYRDGYLLHKSGFCSGISPGLTEDLKKQASQCADASQDSFPVESGFADQQYMQENNKTDAFSDCGELASQELHCLTRVPKGRPIPLCTCRYSSSGEEKVATGTPSEHKKLKEATPFSPTSQPCEPPSSLLSARMGNLQRHLTDGASGALAESPQDVTTQAASPLFLGDQTDPLAGKEGLLKLQATSSQPPDEPSFMHKDLSEGEHSDTLLAVVKITRSPSVPLQGIFLGPSPSDIYSTQCRDEDTDQGLQGTEEAGSHSPKVSAVELQHEAFSKDVDIEETLVADFTQADDAAAAQHSASHCPETWCSRTSQNTASRQNEVKKEGCEQGEQPESFPSSREQEKKGKRGNSEDDSKTGQLEEEGLQVACDSCSISSRFKTGLLRPRVAKGQENERRVLLASPALGPSKPASKRNRKTSVKERGHSSRIPKTASGQVVPRSYRRQRKAPTAEIQEVVSRVLSDLSVTHEPQSTDCFSEDTKTTSAPLAESMANTRKDSETEGMAGEARPVGLGSLTEKKLRKKGRKGKGAPDRQKDVKSSHVENEISGTVNLTSTEFSKDMENGHSSAEAQAEGRSPVPPYNLSVGGFEVDERRTSAKEPAREETFQEAQSGGGKGTEDPEAEEKLHPQDSWQPGPPQQVKKVLSHLCEEQSDSINVEEPEAKDSSSDEANCTNQNNLLILPPSPKSQQHPLDSGPDKKGSIEETSEKAAEGSSGPGDSKSWGTGETPQSNEGPDLQSLFDDDTTFSQLFPRNDHFARRKCTRVYGKRTKKLRPVAETNPRPEVSRDLFTIRMASDLGETSSFCVTREDPCEYETISIDDALMLNMCHNNKTTPSNASSTSPKSAASQPVARQREEATDLKKDDAVSFLCQTSPTEALPTLSNWDALGKEVEAGPLLSSPAERSSGHSVAGASPEPPDLEKEPYDTRRNENPTLPEFHTIDLEMLNTKFEARDTPSNPAEESRLPPVDEHTLGLKQTSVGQGKPIRNKLEEGKPGKSRSDLKTKEKQYKCKVCFQWFLTLGELDFHKLTHNPSPPPTCYMCVQRKFSSREQLRDHLKEKHAKNKAGLWACGMCLKEISDVWMYNEHLREHATQFARKGQAQKSVLGMPGCFSEDNVAVTHFLNSILCRKPSKASKNAEPGSKALVGKDSKVPKEPQGQEGKVSKDLSEGVARIKPPASSPKAPTVPSPAPAPKAEGPPMHPECKDPSRDCHHCGKQFPKPFKLQRHLVVHSLQKIFLCHKCPMFYQETRELRSHLSQEHGTAEEADIKHTTLYACELCADVMHVIKKSFICSTCNYTFSKKEQYDRHMEKHLAGGSKTFRFQGVMRPGAFPKEGGKKIKEESRPREGTPAAKKKKVLHHTSSPAQGSPVHLDSLRSPLLGGEALLPPSEPLSAAVRVTKTPPPQAPVKAEEQMGAFPGFLAEIEESQFDRLPSPPPLALQQTSDCPEVRHVAGLPTGQLMKRSLPDENPPLFFDSPDAISIDLASLAHKRAEGQELSPPHLSEKHETPEQAAFSSAAERALGTWGNSQLQEEPMRKMHELAAGSTECKGSGKGQWAGHLNGTVPQESACKLNSPEVAFHALPLKDKTSSPALNRPAKKTTGSLADSENGTSGQNSLSSPGEVQKALYLKDKAPPETGACPKDSRAQVSVKDGGTLQTSPASDPLPNDTGSAPARHNHSEPNTFQERSVANGLAKAHPKKRREHKSSHKGSSASRENIEGDGGGKRKKVRWPEAMRGEGAGGFTRADWSSSETLALSPRRRDTHCNKLSPKPKASMRSGQLKKTVLDQCFQKKAEARHSNGELKRKKDVLGKTYHTLLSKDPSPSPASSLNRPRAVQGAKLPEAHHYRTAESQNNLLNQLFGQKLTSFKIPLRRDTSE